MKFAAATLAACVLLLAACSATKPAPTTSPTASPGLPLADAGCPAGTVDWGARTSSLVLVAASGRTVVKRGVWTTVKLLPRVELRSGFTSDRPFPHLAEDLLAAYDEGASLTVGSMGEPFPYQKNVRMKTDGDGTVVSYQEADQDTVDFSYTCSDGQKAHGTMTAWTDGPAGSFNCPGSIKLSARLTALRTELCSQ
ncbi:hypothetical protein [Streptacidiphilus sp. PAMC 29251]